MPVVARDKNENKYSIWSVQMVAGDRAANPLVPTVFPTKALSMFDSNGFERKIPRAGTANFSIWRFDPVVFIVDISEVSTTGLASESVSIVSLNKKGRLCVRVVLVWTENPFDCNSSVAKSDHNFHRIMPIFLTVSSFIFQESKVVQYTTDGLILLLFVS